MANDATLQFDWLPTPYRSVPHPFGAAAAIWRIELPCGVEVPPALIAPREWQRATRMTDRAEAQWLLASHAALRAIVGMTLGVAAYELDWADNGFGKPRLRGDPLRFNMSRSGSAVLIGLSESCEIGVDIEAVRPLPDAHALARAHCSEREYDEWCRGDAQSADTRFLSLWTRKEACVKAAGFGTAIDLRCIEVGADAAGAVRSVRFHFGAQRRVAQVVSLAVPDGFVAAAALIGPA